MEAAFHYQLESSGSEHTLNAAPSLQSAPLELSLAPCSVHQRREKDLLQTRYLIQQALRYQGHLEARTLTGTLRTSVPQSIPLLQRVGSSTQEWVPGLPRPTPEVPIHQIQDPVPVLMTLEAYAAARELFNLLVPVFLAVLEGL